VSVTDDEVSGYDQDVVSLYPLLPFTPEEAVKVVVYGLHRPERRAVFNDVEGVRAGFLILGVMVAGLVLVGIAVVALTLWVKR